MDPSLRIGAIMSPKWFEPFEASLKLLGFRPVWLAETVSQVPENYLEQWDGLVIELSTAVVDVSERPGSWGSISIAGLPVERDSETIAELFGVRRVLREEEDAQAWLETSTSRISVSPPPLIAVWGTAGSPGATTLAVGLARGLARHQRTLLVDADFVAPSCAEIVGVSRDNSGLLGALRVARNPNPPWEALAACASPAKGRQPFEVLAGVRPGSLERLEAGAMSHLVDSYRAQGVALVVEAKFWSGSSKSSPELVGVESILGAADHVFVVGQLSDLGISRVVRDWNLLVSVIKEKACTFMLRAEETSDRFLFSEASETLGALTGCFDVRPLPHEEGDQESSSFVELLQSVGALRTIRSEKSGKPGKSEGSLLGKLQMRNHRQPLA